MLTVSSLSYAYGQKSRPSLTDVSFQVGSGVTVLMGENGAGKSTLMRCIQGELKPLPGAQIQYEGSEASAYLPQDPRWIGRYKVIDLLRYSAWWRGVPSSERARRVVEVIAEFSLSELAEKRLNELSGGQYRRVMLAQSVCARPSVVLLDEPLTGLDIGARESLINCVAQLGRSRVVVVSTHEVEVFEPVADYVVILRGGRCGFAGRMSDVTREITDSVSGEKSTSLLRVLYDRVHQGNSS